MSSYCLVCGEELPPDIDMTMHFKCAKKTLQSFWGACDEKTQANITKNKAQL